MAAKRSKQANQPKNAKKTAAKPPKKAAPAKRAAPKPAPKPAAKPKPKPSPAKSKPAKPVPAKAKPAKPKPAPSKAAPSSSAPSKSTAKPAAAKPAGPNPTPKASAKTSMAKPSTKGGASGKPSSGGEAGKLVLVPAASSSKSGQRPAPAGKQRSAEALTLVPAQSRPSNAGATRAPAVTLVRRASERPPAAAPPLPLPVRKVEEPLTLEQRYEAVQKRLSAPDSEELRKKYEESLDMSWIYHDSALEGVVYTLEELRAGLSPEPVIVDSSLQPAVDEIRRHKEAIDYVRDYASKSRQPITMDVIKKIFLILHPSEGDLKTVRYRRDIPQHRLYFHEYAAPDKIALGVRKVVDWLNEPETKKTRNGLRIAARAHYDLLRVFPFQNDSGKVSRLFMNLLLLRGGYPAAIIHSTERQRYYDALKGAANVVLQMVQEAVENSLASVEKLLDEHEAKLRGQPAAQADAPSAD